MNHKHSARVPQEDLLSWFPWSLTKLHSLWLHATYPFAAVGEDLSVHYSCDMRRRFAPRIWLGNSVLIAADVWINVAVPDEQAPPALVLEDRTKIGRRCMLSARNSIHLKADVSVAPGVLLMDHNHAYAEPGVPVELQGLTSGGRIRIEHGAWIGHGAALVCNDGELVIGHNTVIAANSLVTRSFPPCCLVAGNPARILKQYDPVAAKWIIGGASNSIQTSERLASPAIV